MSKLEVHLIRGVCGLPTTPNKLPQAVSWMKLPQPVMSGPSWARMDICPPTSTS